MANELFLGVRSKNNIAKYVMLGLLGSSIIFSVAAIIATSYTGLIWMVAFAFVTATIYVYNRYVGTEYCYSINDYGSSTTFEVCMRNGKTSRTMARLDLYAIRDVKKLSGKEYRAYKREKGVFKYAYFPTMFPNEVYLVSVRSEHESADVFVEINDELAKALLGWEERVEGMDI